MLPVSLENGIQCGRVEVICGCMFSGKTGEIIRRLREAEGAGRKVAIFKPAIDQRYHPSEIVSHNGRHRMGGRPVSGSAELLALAGDAEVVGIDEAQFFDADLSDAAEILARRGVRVIIAGLDMDFRGAAFGPMPQLLARAELVTKLQAVCSRCGAPASYSHRKSNDGNQILIGEQDVYEARCRSCFFDGSAG